MVKIYRINQKRLRIKIRQFERVLKMECQHYSWSMTNYPDTAQCNGCGVRVDLQRLCQPTETGTKTTTETVESLREIIKEKDALLEATSEKAWDSERKLDAANEKIKLLEMQLETAKRKLEQESEKLRYLELSVVLGLKVLPVELLDQSMKLGRGK
jgi:hypothetical protein